MPNQSPIPADLGVGHFSQAGDYGGIPIPGSDPADHHQVQGHSPIPGLSLPLSRRPTTRHSRSSTTQHGREREFKGLSKSLSTTPPSNPGLDPLSTQIYLRTNNTPDASLTQRLLTPSRPSSPTPDALHDVPTKISNGAADSNKDRRRGPSFLSRLGGMRGAWRKDGLSLPDSDSEYGDVRTEGSNAQAMTTIFGPGGGGYIPFYKEPPRYIRVRAQNKKVKAFDRLFLAQELLGTKPPLEDGSQTRAPATAVGSKLLKAGDAIWAAEFSLDGRYLAVAGKDQSVRVFSVISTPEERQLHEEEEASQNRGNGERLSAPVFQSKPTREFKGHSGEILALSWSKNNFILSSSMDKTVKLWHVSRKECLCTFKHNDLVTSIAFHPTDDRFFLAGSLDAQLRLWSIPDKSVAYSAQTNEFITAVAFSPDGRTAICGVLSGLCIFYDTEALQFRFQIHVRSSRGKNAKGSKITGIKTAKVMSGSADGEDVKVLISSNDSRVRMYSLTTRMLEIKFKGLENQSSQIHARFSEDGTHIISGSEDRRAYIWSVSQADPELKDKQPYECFDAHPEVVTTALMAPTKSKQLLSASGDPIYDLCNPPPVTLLSIGERAVSQSKSLGEGLPEHASGPKKPDESPAYLERSKHREGNIIVTADRTGTIKVFRQDCAYAKRQQNTWETGSKLSGKLAGVSRSASIMTKTSAGSRVHSRSGSFNLGPQPATDRIMSWRQDVDGRASISGTPTRSERSVSPMKATSPPAGPRVPPTPGFSRIAGPVLPPQVEGRGEGRFWNLSRWRTGLSTARFPAGGMSAGPDDATRRQIDNLNRTFGAKPAKPTTLRRSLGINDFRRLSSSNNNNNNNNNDDDDDDGDDGDGHGDNEEGGGRRKSTGRDIPARPVGGDAETAGGLMSRAPKALGHFSHGKRRTDSGVAQMSADSTDESESPGPGNGTTHKVTTVVRRDAAVKEAFSRL